MILEIRAIVFVLPPSESVEMHDQRNSGGGEAKRG